MKDENRSNLLKVLRFIILAVCVLIILVWLIVNPDVSVQTLLDHTPQNPVAAAVVILLLYAFKSITVFFPLIVLEITTGYIFPSWEAVLINFAGILIVLTVPYGIGRTAGMDTIQKQIQKRPKFEEILKMQKCNSFFLCFFLRIISCLPGDIVTMYLGATKTPFWKNLVAGTLGILPGMLLATLLGRSIQDPKSPIFWLSAGLTVILAALSVLVYYLYRRRMKKKEVDTK